MNLSKKRLFMNVFFNLQFSYCPLVWMCHSNANNSIINRLHKSSVRIIFSDKQSSYKAFLDKDGSVQILITKMYKVSKSLSHPIITETIKPRDEQHYNLKNNAEFTVPVIRTAYHGS